jgi:hypothetical protein
MLNRLISNIPQLEIKYIQNYNFVCCLYGCEPCSLRQKEKRRLRLSLWLDRAFWDWLFITYKCITNLFKQTGLKIAFRAANKLQQLTQKQACKNPSGIYKLKCNTCDLVYVGQCGRAINIRHKEHIRYISVHLLVINNQVGWGCSKMVCWGGYLGLRRTR